MTCWFKRRRSALLPLFGGMALLASAGNSLAEDRTAVLGYICATYDSARSVALNQGWKRPEAMPGDCRSLLGRGLEKRIATILDVIELVPTEDGRWIEIGTVRGKALGKGYSAGIAAELLML